MRRTFPGAGYLLLLFVLLSWVVLYLLGMNEVDNSIGGGEFMDVIGRSRIVSGLELMKNSSSPSLVAHAFLPMARRANIVPSYGCAYD